MTFAQPFKDYEILERIGSGAMGTVFKARQKRLDRMVALKVLKPTLARNTKFVERLRREARIVGSLNHPDIVAGYDLGEEGGYHFFVMEFVEGKSLATLLKEWGAFPEEQVLDVATRVASALDHAFKKGVIHRDVKPGNILIDTNGRAKLTDMGLAKAPEDVTITQEGATVGTPQYISPEQARDPSKADVRSDLYSLGATMFHMCTGQPPFPGASLANVIHAVIHSRAPSATAINPALSDGLSLVIRKLLAKDPMLRYQTPSELLQDLHRVRRSERPQVDVDALAAEDAEAPPARRVLRRGLLGVTAAATALVLAWALWPQRPTPAQKPDTAHTFLARVQADVAAAEGWRGKLRALMMGAADARTDEERRAVADLRSGILIPWQDALVEFVRERRRQAPSFVLVPEHWRDPMRVLRAETIESLERTFNIARAELPSVLVTALDAELTRLDAEITAAVVQRDQNLLAAYQTYLEGEVAIAWQTALEGSDFAGAARALRDGSAEFFGVAGRPRREQLASAASDAVARLEERVVGVALAQIDRAEAVAVADMHRAVDEALADMRTQLRDGFDPYVLRQRFDAWRTDLAARYPSGDAFRVGKDPWPRVADAQAVFVNALTAGLAAADRRRLHASVQLAVGALLADGDASQELQWLRERSIDDAAVRALRDRWVRLLGDTHAARDWLLEALATRLGGRSIAVSDPNVLGRTVQVGVRKDGGRTELVERDGARLRRLSLAALRVSELIDQVPPPGADDGATGRGLALWLYGAGESSAAARRLPPADSAFFGEHVAGVVQVVLSQRQGDEAAARESLGRLRTEFRALPAAALRTALDGFDRSFGHTAVAQASEPVLNDLRSHLRACEQRQDTLATLRASVAAGLEVSVEAEGGARVICDPARAENFVLGSGWRRRGARFEFEVENLRFDATRSHALVLGDGLSVEHGVTFSGTIEFVAQGAKPRLYLFEVHGIGVALGLTASDQPFAVVLSAEDLTREKILHREIERELDALVEPRAGVPVVIVGARHHLTVVVGVQANRLTAQVALDGVELRSGNVVRTPKTAARVLVMPMQPMFVWRAVVEGQP